MLLEVTMVLLVSSKGPDPVANPPDDAFGTKPPVVTLGSAVVPLLSFTAGVEAFCDVLGLACTGEIPGLVVTLKPAAT